MSEPSVGIGGMLLGGACLLAALLISITAPDRPIVTKQEVVKAEVVPSTWGQFVAAVDTTSDNCTTLPFMTELSGGCASRWANASGPGWSTCRGCLEDFKRACAPSENLRDWESESQCILREIAEHNVCEKTYWLDPLSTNSRLAYRDGFGEELKITVPCFFQRPKHAIPKTRYYRAHCRDGYASTAAELDACTTAMVAQWEAGEDDPHPKNNKLTSTQPLTREEG